MSIIFFRFFLLFSVVANMVGPKTRYHRACSRSLTSLVLSRSLRFAAKILYEIMLVRIFCNFSFFFTQFFWLMDLTGLWAGLGSCFGDFCGFSYFFLDFFRLLGLVGELFWDFCGFSYFFLDFFRLLG